MPRLLGQFIDKTDAKALDAGCLDTLSYVPRSPRSTDGNHDRRRQPAKAFDTRTGRIQAVANVGFRAGDGQITGLRPQRCRQDHHHAHALHADDPGPGQHQRRWHRCRNPVEVRRHLGVLPDARGVYKRLTARENIAYFGELHGLSAERIRERIEVLSHALDMGDILDRQTDGFSQGQRTKTDCARAGARSAQRHPRRTDQRPGRDDHARAAASCWACAKRVAA